MAGGPTGRKGGVCLRQGLLLLVLLAAVFPGTFLRGEIIVPGDILFHGPPWADYAPEGFERVRNPLMVDIVAAMYPYYSLCSRALAEDAWPLWNPLEYAGMPLLANCQTAAFYPPRLLHVFFDIRVATTLYVLLKLWLCGMTAFLCAWRLGFRLPMARFVSVAYMLGCYNVVWCYWPLPDVSAWLPVLFLGVELTLARRYRGGFFAMSSGATLLLLAGHPETAFTASFCLGIYFAVRLVLDCRWGRDLLMQLGVCSAAWLLALGVCAVQLLPFFEYLRHGVTLFDRVGSETVYPLPPGALITLWVPRFFGSLADQNRWGSVHVNSYAMVYPGVAVWLGVFLLTTRGRTGTPARKRIIALAAAVLFGFLLAFDVSSFGWLHRLPVFSSTIRSYYAGFGAFALPLLAAMGFERWFSRPRRILGLWPVLALVLGVAAFLIAAYRFYGGLIAAYEVTEYVQGEMLAAALWCLLCLGVLAAFVYWRRFRILMGLVLLLSVGDLLHAHRGLNPTMPEEQVFPDTALTDFLRGQEQPCRIGAAEGYIPPGLLAPYGIEIWLGYDGIYPERMVCFQKSLGPEIWRNMEAACGKQYYLYNPALGAPFPLEKESERFEFVTKLDGMALYRFKETLPRAFLVGGLEIINDRDALFDRMKAEDFDPARTVVTMPAEALCEKASSLPPVGDADAGEASITEHTSMRVLVEVNAKREAVLVLLDAFYPGWRATVDGAPAGLFPAYYTFRGVILPPGQHTVEFRYRPISFYAGLWISIASLCLGVLLAYTTRKARGAVAPAGQQGGSPG